jgi:hypothetical protein
MLSHIQLKEIREKIKTLYAKGMTIRQVYSEIDRRVTIEYIRLTVSDLIKKGRRRKQEPEIDPGEVAQRAAAIKASWSPEDARKRWVGYSRNSRSELERAASRLMPD